MNKQRGMGILALFGVAVMVGSAALAAVQISPMYFNFLTVREIARDLYTESQEGKVTLANAKSRIGQRMRQNGLYDMKVSVIKVQRDKGGGLMFTVDYEDRRALFANLDVVASFNHQVGGK